MGDCPLRETPSVLHLESSGQNQGIIAFTGDDVGGAPGGASSAFSGIRQKLAPQRKRQASKACVVRASRAKRRIVGRDLFEWGDGEHELVHAARRGKRRESMGKEQLSQLLLDGTNTRLRDLSTDTFVHVSIDDGLRTGCRGGLRRG
jgi:hypothetical protein